MDDATKPKETLEMKAPGKFPVKMAVIAAVFIAVGFGIAYFSGGMTGGATSCLAGTSNVLSANDAADKALTYINTNLLTAGTTASLSSVAPEGDLYKTTLTITQGTSTQTVTIYITKDGKEFFMNPVDMTKTPQNTDTGTTFDAPDTAVPDVELYVMSFCPYGMAAEAALAPVIDTLGLDTMTFKPHFIVSQSGSTFSSLHGADEATEDMRQLCVIDEYGVAKWWDYVMALKAEYDTSHSMADSWKNAFTTAAINADRINSCMTAKGEDLMAAEAAIVAAKGVTGSPDMYINGDNFGGLRDAAAYQAAICSAFTTEPSGCSEQVEAAAAGSTPSGSCSS